MTPTVSAVAPLPLMPRRSREAPREPEREPVGEPDSWSAIRQDLAMLRPAASVVAAPTRATN